MYDEKHTATGLQLEFRQRLRTQSTQQAHRTPGARDHRNHPLKEQQYAMLEYQTAHKVYNMGEEKGGGGVAPLPFLSAEAQHSSSAPDCPPLLQRL